MRFDSTEDRPRTDAELAREATIRADPLADVINPLYVRCRRCRQRIKLSPKSYFDLFHWQKHRERCMRRSEEEVATATNESQATTRDFGHASQAGDCGDGDLDAMLYYHKIGTPQCASMFSHQAHLSQRLMCILAEDVLVMKDEVNRTYMWSADVTLDGNYLIIYAAKDTAMVNKAIQ